MPYLTSIERRGIQQGILQKSREAVIEILEVRFERVPDSTAEIITRIDGSFHFEYAAQKGGNGWLPGRIQNGPC